MSSRGDKLQALLDRVQKNRASERAAPFDEAATTPGNVMSPAPVAAKRPSPLEAALGATRPRSAAPGSPTPSAAPVRPGPAPAPAPHRSAAPTPIAKPTPQARPAPVEAPVAARPIAAPAPPQLSGPVATASAAKAVVEPKTFGELYARSIALRLRR
jgi:hypothetical protein